MTEFEPGFEPGLVYVVDSNPNALGNQSGFEPGIVYIVDNNFLDPGNQPGFDNFLISDYFSQVKGDLTNSSLFDGGDVSFWASYIAGNSKITDYANNDPYFVEKADFTGDGKVSGADVVRMASAIAGLDTL